MAQTGSHYEVFVNFRGGDTRQGLVNVLRDKLKEAGICYFYDDERLRPGDEIAKELEGGIEKSQIYIVILSPDYASSKWCLKELSLMFECKEKCNSDSKEIFPILCDVSFEDVKRENGMFDKKIEEKHKDEPKVLEWKAALQKVARLKGWQLGNTGIADFSKLVVEEIQRRLEIRRLSCHLVGMEEEIESLKRSLDIESLDVRFLVIHGKSGAGKTTLAREIFNQICARFDGCSFIADVKECSSGWIGESSCCDGYEYMETRLLQDIPGNEDELSNRLGSKRVLVVLDDVDKDSIKKLKSIRFGAGSRILITTKNGPIDLGTEPEVLLYELKTMSYVNALKLLKRRAFGNIEKVADEQEEMLARSALDSLGEMQLVPLTIEIVGSFLYRKTKKEWRETTAKLDKVSNYDVRQKLRIIYDALEENEAKKVFLDIACFFVNTETTYVEHMWKGCFLDSGIKLLTSMSLVKVIDNKFWMHEELRALGRDIVRQNSEFGKRLWKHEEAWEVLQRDKGNEEVEGLRLSYDQALENVTLEREKFTSLEKLRFLRLYYTKFCKKLERVLPKLRWLSWHHCPDDLNTLQLCLRSLAVLVLSESSTVDGWLGCNHLKEEATCLKVLDLRNCHELKGTPELSKCKNLEMLVLQECGNLTRIDGSVGELTLLKHLTIKGCGSIKELPEELGSLEALEVIIIEGNRDSQPLKLPESIGKLKSLSILVVANVEISKFPDVGGLGKLERLSLSRCSGIKRLPGSLGKLNSLVELDISDSTVEELPDSVGNLKELKVIKMERSLIRKLPSSINLLKKLEELHAKKCEQLEGEISGVDELSRLRILDLSYTYVTGLSQTMSSLTLLQTLLLDGCRLLRGLKELPENLTSLHISFQLLHEMLQAGLPELNNVTDLVIFNAGNDERTELQQVFQWIGRLPKLEHLELDIPPSSGPWPGNFCASSQLKFLKLSCAERQLQHQLDLPSLTLASMSLSNFEVNLSHFDKLQELRYLKLDKCKISGDKRVEVGSMSLVHFYARRCSFDNNVEQVHPSKSLSFLHLKRCRFHHTQLKLSGLDKLKHLELSRCRGLISVQGIDEVKQLEELVIKRCDSLECLEGDISHLKELGFLEIIGCEDLKRIEGWSIMKKNEMRYRRHRYIYECPNFKEESRKRKRSSRLYPSVQN